eukprot:4314243-Alexandrium_andersonii.AAC.1
MCIRDRTLAGAAWQKIERRLAERAAGQRPAVDTLAARLRGDLRARRQIPRSSAYEAVWLATHEREAEAWLRQKSLHR